MFHNSSTQSDLSLSQPPVSTFMSVVNRKAPGLTRDTEPRTRSRDDDNAAKHPAFDASVLSRFRFRSIPLVEFS